MMLKPIPPPGNRRMGSAARYMLRSCTHFPAIEIMNMVNHLPVPSDHKTRVVSSFALFFYHFFHLALNDENGLFDFLLCHVLTHLFVVEAYY